MSAIAKYWTHFVLAYMQIAVIPQARRLVSHRLFYRKFARPEKVRADHRPIKHTFNKIIAAINKKWDKYICKWRWNLPLFFQCIFLYSSIYNSDMVMMMARQYQRMNCNQLSMLVIFALFQLHTKMPSA